MNILIPIFFLSLAYLGFKFLFIKAYVDFTNVNLFTNKKEFVYFLLNPILSKKYTKDKYFKIYYYLSFLLTGIWALLLTFKLDYFNDLSKVNITIAFLYLLVMCIFIGFLLYLSFFDVISFSIPELISKRMVLFAIIVNITFLILKILLSNTEYSYIFGLINLGTFLNLLGGILGGGIIWLIVKISKEKAMGSGDIDILAAIGLMLGFPSILYSFFYTLMAASFISVVYVLIIRKYKGVLIPFVPFLSTGFILCIVLGDAFIKLFSIY